MMNCLTCIYERVWINFGLNETLNFQKKSLSVDYVDGCHDDEEIASTVSKHFSSYQFNSYIISTQFDDCLKSVQSSMMSELLNSPTVLPQSV